jgi:hypothetical protein
MAWALSTCFSPSQDWPIRQVDGPGTFLHLRPNTFIITCGLLKMKRNEPISKGSVQRWLAQELGEE